MRLTQDKSSRFVQSGRVRLIEKKSFNQTFPNALWHRQARTHSPAGAVLSRTHCSSAVPCLLSPDRRCSVSVPPSHLSSPAKICFLSPCGTVYTHTHTNTRTRAHTHAANYVKSGEQKTWLINLSGFTQPNVSQGDSAPPLLPLFFFFLRHVFCFIFLGFFCPPSLPLCLPDIPQPL